MHQSDHEAWNASNYPGTRQLCVECDGETDRCEEDSVYTEEGEGPLCVECWHKTLEYLLENSFIRILPRVDIREGFRNDFGLKILEVTRFFPE